MQSQYQEKAQSFHEHESMTSSGPSNVVSLKTQLRARARMPQKTKDRISQRHKSRTRVQLVFSWNILVCELVLRAFEKIIICPSTCFHTTVPSPTFLEESTLSIDAKRPMEMPPRNAIMQIYGYVRSFFQTP